MQRRESFVRLRAVNTDKVSRNMASGSMDGLAFCKGTLSGRTAQLKRRQEQQQRSKDSRPAVKLNDGVKARQRQLEEAMSRDNFVKSQTGAPDPKDPQYGKPQEGTRTAQRGEKAQKHVHREILELCEIIYMNGVEDEEDNTSAILFGDLFRMYTRISDKVVGILMRARKYGLVYFEPEILYQGRDDEEPVFLLKPMPEIYQEFNENKCFAMPKSANG